MLTLIPVVVGALLGAFVSFSAMLVTSRIQQNQAARTSRAQHLHRMMTLSNDTLSEAISSSFTILKMATPFGHLGTQGKQIATYLAPVFEMRTMAALYFPELEEDVESVFEACMKLNEQLGKETVTSVASSKEADAAAIKINTTVRALQKKIIEIAKRNRA